MPIMPDALFHVKKPCFFCGREIRVEEDGEEPRLVQHMHPRGGLCGGSGLVLDEDDDQEMPDEDDVPPPDEDEYRESDEPPFAGNRW